eukprot:TRINITY_DN12526_c0_g1_i11.p2 TRINITY_DN12526_c0_g1~~TRINITY_DN12526_c0_g1_i11.p2  ORF type:complete len:309 (+),score=92.49 TRINITY_DN12526_c0_g1_i11:399-1325(+)
MVGSKMKSRIMERMKRSNAQTSARKKTLKQSAPSVKGKARNPSKLVIMVQESAKPFTTPSYRSSVTSSMSTQLLPRKSSRAAFETHKVSQFDESSINSASSFVEPALGQANSARDFSDSKSRLRSTYDDLHDQLSKITQELRAEGYNVGELNSQRQRRTREERRRKNLAAPEVDKNEYVQVRTEVLEDINFPQQIRNARRFRLAASSRTVCGSMKGELKNTVYGGKGKKENKQPMCASKGGGSNKHAARKYLGELYSRIIFKVRKIEKEKRAQISIQAKVAEKYESHRAKLPLPRQTLHQTKKSVQLD